jgi:hypothetical protein
MIRVARAVIYFSAQLAIVMSSMFVANTCSAQVTTPLMIGGDIGLNLNIMSTKKMLDARGVLPDFERGFLGSGSGTSVFGSLVCSVPLGGPSAALFSATLEELTIFREDTVIIPCEMYDTLTRNKTSFSKAVTIQRNQLTMTDITLGAAYQYRSGHFIGSAGVAGGAFVAQNYKFHSQVIRPDSCFYNYFTERSHAYGVDMQLPSLRPRIPFTIQIGLLIPFTNRMFFSPSIGLDLDLFGINSSGATITTVRPAVGVRYEP